LTIWLLQEVVLVEVFIQVEAEQEVSKNCPVILFHLEPILLQLVLVVLLEHLVPRQPGTAVMEEILLLLLS
jgi:hypothetical protein